MVVGVGYRLLPMVLPSAMPEGRRIIASLVLVQLGVMGLFVTLLATGEAGPGWAVLSVAGIVTFLSGPSGCVAILGAPLPRDRGQAGGWRMRSRRWPICCSPPCSGWHWSSRRRPSVTARIAVIYGIVGLVGFLSQIVIGLEHRILPLFQWQTRFKASGCAEQPPAPHTMGSQTLRGVVFGLWTVGVVSSTGRRNSSRQSISRGDITQCLAWS